MEDSATIRALLQSLATDPAYRDRFLRDPVGTLTDAGFTVSAADIPPEGVKLPSNEEILANLDSLSREIHQLHWFRLKL